MQSLLLNFLKVTESAAVAVMPHVGSGDKTAADAAATNDMRENLNKMKMDAKVVIGEGEIDNAPMLYIGEQLGRGGDHIVDIAVDPIEGTTPTVNGQGNAIAVIAAAPRGKMLHAPDMYMKKMITGPEAKGSIDINAPLKENMKAVAKAKGKDVKDLNVYIQDRPRHEKYVEEIRSLGAKAYLFNDGDVIYGVATCIEKLDIDLMIGIGGAPEGVITAAAIRSLGGEIQAKLMPRNEEEVARCRAMGVPDTDKTLTVDDLVGSDDCVFAATGITDNLIVDGIEAEYGNYVTHSILIYGKEKQLRYVKSTYSRN